MPKAESESTTEGVETASGHEGKSAERTFTQEDVNRLLAQERRTQESRFAGFEDFKAKAEQFDQIEEQSKTELERMTARAEQAEQAMKRAEHERARLQVATAKGLPPELAARLQGESQEELEADADQLSQLLAAKQEESTEATNGNGFTLNVSESQTGGGVNDAAARQFFGI